MASNNGAKPRKSREQIKETLLNSDPTRNYQSTRFSYYGEMFVQQLPQWRLWTGRMMLTSDPLVNFSLNVRNAALMAAEVVVTAKNPAIMKWVQDQWNFVWNHHRPKLLSAKKWGYSALQVEFKQDNNGLLSIKGIKDFAPEDVRALEQGNKLCGYSVKGSRLFFPQGCWLTFNSEFGSPYGTGCLRRSYPAWYEKWMDHGAKRLLQLRMIKDAYIGDIFWYPPNMEVQLPDGTRISWKDLMREMGENRLSGGAMTLPKLFDDNGRELTSYSPPQDIGTGSQIFDWVEHCDEGILRGADIPTEVIKAADTGSGYSGRSIPFLVVLSVCTNELVEVVQCFNEQVLRPLAWLNWGGEPEYEIVPKSLVESFAADAAGSPLGGSAIGAPASMRPYVAPQMINTAQGPVSQYSEEIPSEAYRHGGQISQHSENQRLSHDPRLNKIIRKQARKLRLTASQYHDAIRDVWLDRELKHSDREAAKSVIKDHIGRNARGLQSHDNQGGDEASIRGLDEVGREVAESYPSLGWGAGIKDQNTGKEQDYAALAYKLAKEYHAPLPSRYSRAYHDEVEKHVEQVHGPVHERAAPSQEVKLRKQKDADSFNFGANVDQFDEQPTVATHTIIDANKKLPEANQHQYSSLQINLPHEIAYKVLQLAYQIPEHDLAEDGRETEPHITVKYGLHTNEAEMVRQVMQSQAPIAVTLGCCSCFQSKDNTSQRGGSAYDVVKIEVISQGLMSLNKYASGHLEHTDTFPNYIPHITLAYVKPGLGPIWAKRLNNLEGTVLAFDIVTFSNKDHQHTDIRLIGDPQFSELSHIQHIPVRTALGNTVAVYKNLPIEHAKEVLKNSYEKRVRMLIDNKNKDHYLWDAHDAIHPHIEDALSLPTGFDEVNKSFANSRQELEDVYRRHELHDMKHRQFSEYNKSIPTQGDTQFAETISSDRIRAAFRARHGDHAAEAVHDVDHEFKEHKQKYGEAKDPDDAGYILPSGYMLDLKRTSPHDAVVHEDVPHGVAGMLNRGAIRYRTGFGVKQSRAAHIQGLRHPTPAQIKKIKDTVERHGHLHLEIGAFNKHYHLDNVNRLEGDLRALKEGRQVAQYEEDKSDCPCCKKLQQELGGTSLSDVTFQQYSEVQQPELKYSIGTAPIPEGHLRVFHYTRANPEDIRKQGLLLSKAKGSTYGEPNMIWGSSNKPDHGHKIVEFHIHPNDPAIRIGGAYQKNPAEWDKGVQHVALDRDIQPHEILGVHEPWHHKYHYAKKNPKVITAILNGEHDDLLSNDEYGPSIKQIKAEHSQQHSEQFVEKEDELTKQIREFSQSELEIKVQQLLSEIYNLSPNLDQPSLADLITKKIHEFGTDFGQSLFEAVYSADLIGRSQVAYLVPSSPGVLVQSVEIPPVIPPKSSLGEPADAPEPRVVLPAIDRAISVLRASPVSTGVNYLDTAEKVRQGMFAITTELSDKLVADVREILADNISQGLPQKDFLQAVAEHVEGSALAPHHVETIFRTNIMSAYSEARMEATNHPLVATNFPYAQYWATTDGRVRPEHIAMESLGLNGTNIYRINDPVFKEFRPPWGYGCRCNWHPVDIQGAAEQGVQEAKEWLQRAKEMSEQRGGHYATYLADTAPLQPEFVKHPPFSAPPEFQRNK